MQGIHDSTKGIESLIDSSFLIKKVIYLVLSRGMHLILDSKLDRSYYLIRV